MVTFTFEIALEKCTLRTWWPPISGCEGAFSSIFTFLTSSVTLASTSSRTFLMICVGNKVTVGFRRHFAL
jgi:hypothetical protein